MVSILRAVALVFVLAGGLMLKIGLTDPTDRAHLLTLTAPVASVQFDAAAKIGRFVTVSLEGSEERFRCAHLGNVPGLEERLQARLVPGVEATVRFVERRSGGWGVPEGRALPIYELSVAGERLLSNELFETSFGRFLGVAVPVLGALGALFGAALLALTFRK
ncbi:MAG: hypothetical protein R3F49_16180 [Planctomycetota bacterium]